MKRKLAIIFLAGCIAAGAFSGCSKNNAPVADASQNTDLADKVTDENSVEDSGNAYSSCLKAIDAIEDAKSVTIDSELIFTMIPINKTIHRHLAFLLHHRDSHYSVYLLFPKPLP